MHDWLAERSAITPERLALLADGERITYGELNRRTAELAGRLAACGVGPGDRIAALLPGGITYVALIHAAARLQAVLAPLNTRLTAIELGQQMARLDPRLLLYSDVYAATARALASHADLATTPDALPAGAPRWQPRPSFDLEATQAIIFTSGTTGEPKGAMLSFANHFWSATASAYRLGVRPDDRWLSCLPLYHVGGLAVLFRACLYGTAAVLHDRFDAAAFQHAIDTQQITGTSVVPTMLHRLLATRREPWPASLRLVLVGGAAAPAPLIAQAREQRLPIAATYGMTEAASQVATALPDAVFAKPGAVGRPLLFTAVRIIDDAGSSLPAGKVGEITVRGPTVMQGYLDDPLATARTLPDGELRTGDVGYLDEEGDLWVVQRRSDIIISGGENIYPAEVEAVLDSHPAILRSCVVGVDDPEWGQRVAALVERRPGTSITAARVLEEIEDRLAGYKRPRILFFTEELPQTASGKIERRAVQSEVARHLAEIQE
jgi:O-succinylbenzoic acid--CoA ligase